MSTTITVQRMSRRKLIWRTRSRIKRWACVLSRHRFGNLKFQACTPTGKVLSEMRRCWCGRMWAADGLSNVSNGDVIRTASQPSVKE